MQGREQNTYREAEVNERWKGWPMRRLTKSDTGKGAWRRSSTLMVGKIMEEGIQRQRQAEHSEVMGTEEVKETVGMQMSAMEVDNTGEEKVIEVSNSKPSGRKCVPSRKGVYTTTVTQVKAGGQEKVGFRGMWVSHVSNASTKAFLVFLQTGVHGVQIAR